MIGMKSLEYFAGLDRKGDPNADPDKRRIIGELQSRIDAYYNWILMTNRLARWRTAYNTYYGQRGQHSSNYVSAAGDNGELSFLMSNEYRNLVQHTLVMSMQSRAALEMVSVNTDSKSKSQAYVAKGLVEYYRRDGRIDTNAYAAGEISLILDTAWVFNEWDVMLGMEVAADPATGQLVRQGDIKSRARTPLDVVLDFIKIDPQLQDWRIVRDPVNKYDLAAQYPEKADEIVSISRDITKDALFRFGDIVNYQVGNESSDIDVWTFFHRRSPALPEGRMFQFTEKTWLFDGAIPYRKLPGNRICPAEQILSPLGYSNANDLLGLQDVLDAMVSAGVTNMTSCGVNNIWTKPSPNFDFEQLAQGMNLIQADEKPEVLILNKLPREWFDLSNWIIQRMESYMGMNQVARGNVEGKDFSGAAMALLQSMAIQFNSGFTRSLNKLTEDNGNDIIMLTQDFASEKRLGMIIGENNRYMMKDYSGKDIAQIQRVYCRQSNPLKDTTAGRLTIAKEAMGTKDGLTSAQFAELIDTGNTDCLLEKDRNAKQAITQENEQLMAGEAPAVGWWERHPDHLEEHFKLLAAPEDKQDPQLIDRVKQHCDAHMDMWFKSPPALLMALKIPPFPQPPPPMPPPGGPPPGHGPGGPGPGPGGPPHEGPPGPPPPPGPQGGPPPPPPIAPLIPPMEGGSASGGQSPPPAVGTPGQAAAQMLPAMGNPSTTKGPSFPTNPLTGQKWNPQSGGL